MLTEIRLGDIKSVSYALDYFMWDTSIDTMVRIGVPTREDVEEWILCLRHRPSGITEEVQECINDCMEYINDK